MNELKQLSAALAEHADRLEWTSGVSYETCVRLTNIAERMEEIAHDAQVEIDGLRAQVEKLKERNRKLDVDLLKGLFYAPSSPVSAQKAKEIEVWYGKFKQVVLAAKVGE